MKQSYDLFESFLDGELNEQERQAFEQRLRDDPELQKQFDAYQTLRRQYQDSLKGEQASAELKQTLEGLGKEFFPSAGAQKPKTRRIPRIWYLGPAVAAACAMLVVFSRPKNLFREYYDTPLAAFTEKGGPPSTWYQQAEQTFNSGDFAAANQLLDSILAEKPGALQASFYKGLCLLELGEPSASRTILLPLAEGASIYSEDARWFISLSYLREKNYAACRAELEKLPPDGRWSEKARKLKGKIRGK